MKLVLTILTNALLIAMPCSSLVVLRPPNIEEIFFKSKEEFWQAGTKLPVKESAEKLCGRLSAATHILPFVANKADYDEIKAEVYSQFPVQGSNFEYPIKSITIGKENVDIALLACFVGQENEVYLSTGFTRNNYFVFAKVKSQSIKLIGLAEDNLAFDTEEKGVQYELAARLQMTINKRGKYAVTKAAQKLSSLSSSQKFRLCGLAYDRKLQADSYRPKQKKVSLELPNGNSLDYKELHMGIEGRDFSVLALQCIIREHSEKPIDDFYVIIEPNNEHFRSIYVASYAHVEALKKKVLWLLYYFENISVLYEDEENSVEKFSHGIYQTGNTGLHTYSDKNKIQKSFPEFPRVKGLISTYVY